MSAGIEVKEFKHIPGVNDAEYIKKLEELREIDKGIINTAVAKIKKLSAQLSAQPEIKKDGDTISRQVAIDALERKLAEPYHTGEDWYVGINCAEAEIYGLPSAQPERKKGRWIVYKAPNKYHCGLCKCPFCGYGMVAESDGYNYCPKCGADMRGEQDG